MAKDDSKPIIVMYVPALSRRFVDFFTKYNGSILYILGYGILNQLTEEISYIGESGRDLWSLRPDEAKTLVESLNIFFDVQILDSFDKIPDKSTYIIMPADDISAKLQSGLMSQYVNIEIVKSKLRWDRMAAFNEDPPKELFTISQDELHKQMLSSAYRESEKSFDWWRQTGAVISRDGEFIIGATNTEVPMLIFDLMGDSRAPFNAGENVDLVLTIHAERAVINHSARQGIRLEGADMYATVFPCRECAAAIIQTGIKRLFFSTGSSRLEAAELLAANGVEIVKVV